MLDEGENVKVRITYEKGSQTLSQCDPTAKDSDLFVVAEAIASLREYEKVEYAKITEARLLG
ncbi:MAG TPA: hypothetical protein GX707_07305 [Epulopiscium sp.]|nr:hypothetical protein [Candidatus Epulonipiscium sp.]